MSREKKIQKHDVCAGVRSPESDENLLEKELQLQTVSPSPVSAATGLTSVVVIVIQSE
jgi:hypothetical protein